MEIERKWLADKSNIPYDLNDLESHELEQSYISFYPTVRVRSVDGNKFVLTIKTKPESGDCNLSRNEVEIELSEKDYLALKTLKKGRVIQKTRYIHPIENKLVEEIDLFHGDLEGLCYVEIEFPDEKTARKYSNPEWIQKDVTEDKRYTNGSLAEGTCTLKELLEL